MSGQNLRRSAGAGHFGWWWSAALGLALVLLAPTMARAEADVRRDAAVVAVEKVLPSIVNISTETIVDNPDPLDELFRDFFDPYNRRRPQDAQKSLGSGVIIDEAGYVLTNDHVVRKADHITVTLVDGREFEAKALSRTAMSDVALLKLVTTNHVKFHAATFAADDDLLLAETVLALGNPFGLGVSVSRGILSSKTRRPSVENEPLGMEDWLQTDAAINPGNSGGALVNLRGELIGLNVAVFREGQGIGFAVPVKRLSEALSEIFTPEETRSLWFGAHFRTRAGRVVTASVEPSSPAEKAGLRTGDVILSVNDQPARTLVEVNRAVVSTPESSEVRLQVQRRNGPETLQVRLVPQKEIFNASLIRRKLGAVVQALSPEEAAQVGMSNSEGLLVVAVERNSPAARAGLGRGCVIQELNQRPVRGVAGAARLLYGLKAGERVRLTLMVLRIRGQFVESYPAKVSIPVR